MILEYNESARGYSCSGLNEDGTQLEEEGMKISQLQESLLCASQQCQEMTKHLDHFITKVDSLEPILMPLQRNVLQGFKIYSSIPSPNYRSSRSMTCIHRYG